MNASKADLLMERLAFVETCVDCGGAPLGQEGAWIRDSLRREFERIRRSSRRGKR